MSNVTLTIGGRHYEVACGDGDEANLLRLAAIVDERVEQAKLVVGDVNEVRQMLFAALFLADELQTPGANQVKNSENATDNNAEYLHKIDSLTQRVTELAHKIQSK